MGHEWIKSTLGHGEQTCRRCSITNREAAILGLLNKCEAISPDLKPHLRLYTDGTYSQWRGKALGWVPVRCGGPVKLKKGAYP